jgi:ATP-binding cassette subfamily A (ABC1) protein 3
MVYGASTIPLNYLYSFGFTNHSTAQISVTLINFVTGFVLVLAYFVMHTIAETYDASNAVVHLFRFFPGYNLGEGLINLTSRYLENELRGQYYGTFDWHVGGRSIAFMVLEAIGFGLMVLLSESKWLRNLLGRYQAYRVQEYGAPPPSKHEIDDDVIEEEVMVKKYVFAMQQQQLQHEEESSGDAAGASAGDHAAGRSGDEKAVGRQLYSQQQQYEGSTAGILYESFPTEEAARPALSSLALLIDQLVKVYMPMGLHGKPKYAVRGLSLACRDGERFGLLGINGAGKTSTLGILTGEIDATAGSVYIGNRPLADGLTQRMLGYCPQVDPLLELMTGYETLFFFGRIRGLSEELLQRRVPALIYQTGLLHHAHRPCGTYSGGNKRKLSLAVALIGDPKVLLLDEVGILCSGDVADLLSIACPLLCCAK